MFLNAIMLAGIGGAVLPLVLHLLSRARYKEVEWGAMMFLPGADSHQRYSARAAQYILLLLRMATIGLLAAAMARPVIQGTMARAVPGGRVTAALLLDCSASMGYDENGRSRFQMAQAAARQVLRGLHSGDRAFVIEMGVSQSDADLEPTGDLRAVEAKIDEAKIGYGRATVRDALSRAADVLDRYEKTNRDIYVVCDRQALSWKGVEGSFADEWRRRMRGASPEATPAAQRATRIMVIPVGGPESDNVAVESIKLLNPPAIFYKHADGTPAPAEIEVTIHNYGDVPRIGIPVNLSATGVGALPPRTVNLATNQLATVTFPIAFPHAGSFVVSAGIKASGYLGDDHLESVVHVIDPIRVLVISGEERSSTFRGAGNFISWALAPHAAMGETKSDPLAVTLVSADEWGDIALDEYSVVVLANVERFSPAEARDLERYVYDGGRLLIAPGSLSRYELYNSLLYREGAGILPAQLDAPTPADGSQATTLLSWDTSSPVFQFLRGQFEAPAATIARYFPAHPRQVDANALAWYLTGDPFLIEGRSERGRVLLLTTSLDADWTTMPLSNFYLPFVQSAVRYLASGANLEGNLAQGQQIRLAVDPGPPAPTVMLTRPDGRSEPLPLVHLAQQTEVRFADTDQPGEYQIRISRPGAEPITEFFVVRPPREESDLTELTEEQWASLENQVGFQRVDPSVRPLRETLASGREGRELWAYVLAGVFVLIVMEMMLSRRASLAPNIQTRETQTSFSFSPVTRSEGWDEEPGHEAEQRTWTNHEDPSPLPSPLSTGARENVAP